MTQTTPSHGQAVEAAGKLSDFDRWFGLQSKMHLATPETIAHNAWYASRSALTSQQEVAAPAGDALTKTLITVIERFLDEVRVPDRNCSCHISPPCSDCVDNNGMREIINEAQDALAIAASRVPVASLAEPEGDVQLRACDQTTGREYFIKKGPRAAMQAEADAMNEKGRDYFVIPPLPATREQGVEAVGAVPVEWDGKLNDTLQRSLNALYLECAPEIVNSLTHTVRESFRAVCTDRATLQHMLKGALAKLPIEEGGTAPPSSKTQDDLAGAECENCNQLARALREATEAPTFMGEPVTQWPLASNWVWTHIKSGGEYSLLGNAMIQSAKPLEDLSEVYVYQGEDGNMWVRPVAEFNERFKRTRPLASQPKAPAPVPVVQGEIERLTAALKWYADGNHFVLDDDWDTVSGEPQEWLCGPESGMVEDGGVARTVLAGGHMVDDDEEIIAEALLTDEQYKTKLARIEALIQSSPAPDSDEGIELVRLSSELERYEKRVYRFDPPPGGAGGDVGAVDFRQKVASIERSFDHVDGTTFQTPWVKVEFLPNDWMSRDFFADWLATPTPVQAKDSSGSGGVQGRLIEPAIRLLSIARWAAGKIEVERRRGAGYHHAEVDALVGADAGMLAWLKAAGWDGGIKAAPTAEEIAAILSSTVGRVE